MIAALGGLVLFAAGAVAGFTLLVSHGHWPASPVADLAAVSLLAGLGLTWAAPGLAWLVRRGEQQRPQLLRGRTEHRLDLGAPRLARPGA